MMNQSLKRHLPAVLLAVAVGGGAIAQSSHRTPRTPPDPKSNFQADSSRVSGTSESRDLRDMIDELEQSSSDDVRTGRIGRYFTNPAVIITNGQVHQIDWSRIRGGRTGDEEPRYQDDRADRQGRDDRTVQPEGGVRIENFQSRRIDPRTMVVFYTAVIPGAETPFRQPVVATLVRDSSSRPWRIATYTAENAAIPGEVAPNDDEGAGSPIR
jgi:hypothetical protein